MRMSVEEAAKHLKIYPMGLRVALRQGRFSEFGQAWKIKKNWSYYINRNKFFEYINGGKADEIN